MDIQIKGDLMWPLITSQTILHKIKNVGIHNVMIYRNIYQNWLINVWDRNNLTQMAFCDDLWGHASFHEILVSA